MEIPYVPSPNNILSIMQWKKVVQPVSVLYWWIVVDNWESRKPSASKTGKPPNSSSSRQSFYPDLRRFIKKAWWRDSAHDHQLNHAQGIEHTVVRLLDSQTECWLWASWIAFKSGVLFFSRDDNRKCQRLEPRSQTGKTSQQKSIKSLYKSLKPQKKSPTSRFLRV